MHDVLLRFVVLGSLLLLAGVVVLRRLRARSVTVLAYQRGVRFSRGAMDRVLEPGVYWTWAWQTVTLVDMRLQVLQVPGQELLTSDGVTVKVTLGGEYRVVDAARFVVSSASASIALYHRGQEALRVAVAGEGFEALLAGRVAIGARIREYLAGRTEDLGIEVTSLEVRDVLLSGELRRAFALAATAQKEALAALERARGETASLRSLANAARLMQDLPALGQLRAIQAAESSRGNTLVLGVPVSEAVRPGRGDPPTA